MNIMITFAMRLSYLFLVFALLLVGRVVFAQCSSDVSFMSSYPSEQASLTNPTVEGLPLPVDATDIVNKLYTDRAVSSAVSYLGVAGGLNSNADSPLALDIAGDAITSTLYKTIAPTSGDVFYDDVLAAHPRSHKKASRYQIDYAYPSALTDNVRVDNAEDFDIDRYFLSTALVKDQDNLLTSTGMQTLFEAPNIQNTSQVLGTIGGLFYRYRDASQYADNWSNWQRLDNREVDAMFARVDALKFNNNVISADNLTPFSRNLRTGNTTGGLVTGALDLRDAAGSPTALPIYLAAKGNDSAVLFGTHANNQHNSGGALNAVFGISVAASDQVISSLRTVLTLDSASSNFQFLGADVAKVPNTSIVTLTSEAGTATASFADFNLSSDVNANNTSIVSQDTSESLILDGASGNIAFINDRLHNIERLDDVGGLEISENFIASEAGTISFQSAPSLPMSIVSRVTNIEAMAIGNFQFDKYNTELLSLSGNIAFDATSGIIDFSNDDVLNVDNITIAGTLQLDFFVVDLLTFDDNEISTSAGSLEIDANTSNISFSHDDLDNITKVNIGHIEIDGNKVSNNGLLSLSSASNEISFSNKKLVDINSLRIDLMRFDGDTISNGNREINFVSAGGTIDFGNNNLSAVASLGAGGLRVTGFGISSSATSDIKVQAGSGTIDINQSRISDTSGIFVNDLVIKNDIIENNSSGDLVIKSNTGIVLDSGSGEVSFSSKGLSSVNGTPSADNDLALKGYIDGILLGSSVGFSPMNGDLDMNGHNIINLADPVNATDAANNAYIKDSFTLANLTDGDLDMNGYKIINHKALPTRPLDGSAVPLDALPSPGNNSIDNYRIKIAYAKVKVNLVGRMTFMDKTPVNDDSLKWVYISDYQSASSNIDDTLGPTTHHHRRRLVGVYWDSHERATLWVSTHCGMGGSETRTLIDDSVVKLGIDFIDDSRNNWVIGNDPSGETARGIDGSAVPYYNRNEVWTATGYDFYTAITSEDQGPVAYIGSGNPRLVYHNMVFNVVPGGNRRQTVKFSAPDRLAMNADAFRTSTTPGLEGVVLPNPLYPAFDVDAQGYYAYVGNPDDTSDGPIYEDLLFAGEHGFFNVNDEEINIEPMAYCHFVVRAIPDLLQ